MCGLVASTTVAKNGYFNPDMEILFSLMYLNQLRGTDSTGGVAICNNGDSYVHKAIGSLSNFFKQPDYEEKFRKHLFQKGVAFIGHGRAATRGTVSLKNAHPFEVKRVDGSVLTLAHNGTLLGHQSLPDFHKHDVDSAWIADTLARESPEILGRINGAMALIWYDSRDYTLNFFRNTERPLSFLVNNGAVYLASEAATLQYIRYKHYLQYKEEDVMDVEPLHHYKLNLKEAPNLLHGKDIPYTKVDRVYSPPPEYKGSNWDRFWKNGSMGTDSIAFDDPEDYEPTTNVKPPNNVSLMPSWQRHKKALGTGPVTGRSVIDDCKNFFRAEIRKVEWNLKEETRTTYFTYSGAGKGLVLNEKNCLPYLHDLVCMESNTHLSGVVFEFKTEHGTRSEVKLWEDIVDMMEEESDEDENPNPDIPVLLLTSSVADVNKDSNIKYTPCLTYKPNPGKRVHFTTPGDADGKVIKHVFKCAPERDGRVVDWYRNDLDGLIRKGDDMVVEPAAVHESGRTAQGSYFRVQGYRVKADARMDRFSEITFYVNGASKAEIEKVNFWKGKVGLIRVNSKADYEKEGSFMVIYLKDVEPVQTFIGAAGNA